MRADLFPELAGHLPTVRPNGKDRHRGSHARVAASIRRPAARWITSCFWTAPALRPSLAFGAIRKDGAGRSGRNTRSFGDRGGARRAQRMPQRLLERGSVGDAVLASRRRSRTAGATGLREASLNATAPCVILRGFPCIPALPCHLPSFFGQPAGRRARRESGIGGRRLWWWRATTTRDFRDPLPAMNSAAIASTIFFPGRTRLRRNATGFQAVTVSPIFVEVNQKLASGFRSASRLGA